jgi:hypothetical protein
VSLSRTIVLAIAMCPALGSAAVAQNRRGEFRFETADSELIERLARENAVDTEVPRRGVFAYLGHLGHRLAIWFMDLLLQPLGRYAKGVGNAIGGAALVAAVLTAVLLLFVGLRFVFRRRSQHAPNPASSAIPGPAPQLSAWDTARWRQELQHRIEESDVAGSLEAVWWWLARSLLGSRVQDSWTSGDLLSSANRGGLKEPVRRLERMMYGTRTPSLEEILDLVRSLESQLA